MAYKDLLVHVDDTRSCAARLQAAVDLAAAHEAHLTGVYIIAEFACGVRHRSRASRAAGKSATADT